MNYSDFKLDQRLENDTFLIDNLTGNDHLWQTRLMNDQRWPWIIVIPTIPGLLDMDDLNQELLEPFFCHLHKISHALKAASLCNSTNIATLSNVVTQMHWHVVGRNEGDANWPGPVLGYGTARCYGEQEKQRLISSFKSSYREHDAQ